MSNHRTASIYFVFQDKMHIIQKNERFVEMYEDGGDDKAAGLGNRGNSAFWKDNRPLLFRSSFCIRTYSNCGALDHDYEFVLWMWNKLPD